MIPCVGFPLPHHLLLKGKEEEEEEEKKREVSLVLFYTFSLLFGGVGDNLED